VGWGGVGWCGVVWGGVVWGGVGWCGVGWGGVGWGGVGWCGVGWGGVGGSEALPQVPAAVALGLVASGVLHMASAALLGSAGWTVGWCGVDVRPYPGALQL
jgi:hypothetical protein